MRDDQADTQRSPNRLRQRVLLLAIVLLFSTVITPALHRMSPAQSYAVVSDSMEPTIPKDSLVIVEPGIPEVGEVGAYESPMGRVQIHRLHHVEIEDGTRYYTFKGDNNPTHDSFRVTEDDIVGIATGHVEGLGGLWALSFGTQLLVMGGLVGAYLLFTGWESRSILRSKGGRLTAVIFGLLLVAPLAAGGVQIGYPDDVITADVIENPPALLEAGTDGRSTVASTNASASVTAPEPTVWKSIGTMGGPGEWEISTTSWTRNASTLAHVDAAQYHPAPTFHLEATMRAPDGETIKVRLVDTSDGTAVSGSKATQPSTSKGLVRSAGFSLSGNTTYAVEATISETDLNLLKNPGFVSQVKLLAQQDVPDDTVTQIRLHSNASRADETYGPSPERVQFQWDDDWYDGVTETHLAVVGYTTSGDTGSVRLYDVTAASTVASVDVSGTASQLHHAWNVGNLTDGHAYRVELQGPSNTDSGDETVVQNARLVVRQDALQRTVEYHDLATYNDSDSDAFEAQSNLARLNEEAERVVSPEHLEATLAERTATSGTNAEARLVENASGDVVTGSTVSEGSTTPTRHRADVTLPAANTTYLAEAAGGGGSGYAIGNAWIVNRIDQTSTLTYDDLLRTAFDDRGCRWAASMALDTSSGTDRLGRTNVSLRKGGTTPWDAATLAGPREAAGTVWNPTDRVAYVLGGRDDAGNAAASILRYDPANGTSTNLTTELPSPRTGASAVWDDEAGVAYVFGGWNATSGDETDEIVRFDPDAGTTSVVDRLPSPRTRTAAAWNGSQGVAYVVGGFDDATASATGEIVRYDPATGDVSSLSATVGQRERAGLAWDGATAYVMGGRDEGGARLDTITAFDPASGTTTNLSSTLPTPLDDVAALWDGSAAHVIGGSDGAPRSEIVEFDPARGLVTTVAPALPEPRRDAGAVWTGSMAVTLGGNDGAVVDDEVAHVNLTVTTIRAGSGSAEATGAVLHPDGGETLHHVLDARPEDHGATSFDTGMEVECPSPGIATVQNVLYRVE